MTGSSHLLSLLDEVASVTWRLVEDLDETHLRSQFDPGFSPIGWHLGHIAWQKARFLLGASAHSFKLGPDALWDSFASDKSCRGPQLSDKAKLVAHMREVHERVRNLFHKPHDSLMAERVHFIANHERQHAEIIATNRLLGRLPLAAPLSARAVTDPMPDFESFLKVDATDFIMGADDDIDGWDNERRAHRVRVQSFFIQREPVTCGAWLEFIRAGGYSDARLWDADGNAWRIESGVSAPLYWFRDGSGSFLRHTLGGIRAVEPRAPVCHVSWYEAAAFARFAGARLPTEAEWECAASWDANTASKRRFPWGDDLSPPIGGAPASWPPANLGFCELDAGARTFRAGAAPCGARDLAGSVWEWVADTFKPYPDFAPQAYAGYSAPWFDGRHRVARGGSFMTQAQIARNCFRNWYEPHLRQPALGLRLAKDG